MKTYLKKGLGIISGLCLCLALESRAQQPGGGQFGGGGFQGGQARPAGQQQQYNSAGGVGNATITVDPDSRNLTILADEETTRYISEVINNLDQPQPQVLIKVVFIEVTHNDSLDIGFEGSYNHPSSSGMLSSFVTNFAVITNFTSIGSSNFVSGTSIMPGSIVGQTNNFLGTHNFGLSALPGPAGIYSILGADFQATLRAIAQAGKAQLLSRPSILARNNQPATIVIGQQVPLITNVRYDTFGNAINSVTYQNVGIILRVTPFITDEGLVQMIVQPQTSAIDNTVSIPISAGVFAPVIAIRSADTVVVTPNGQTVVIGGLMRNDSASAESKIPFLGDIPFLGALFKRKVKSNAKTELLIFLTPHVIGAPSQLAALTDKERTRTLLPKSYSEQELDRFLDKLPEKPATTDKKSKR